MGIKNAMPAQEHLLEILLAETRQVLPKATWTAAGIGRHQSEVMRWVLSRGGDGVRTGLEDNIRIGKDRLAKSNAELVRTANSAPSMAADRQLLRRLGQCSVFGPDCNRTITGSLAIRSEKT